LLLKNVMTISHCWLSAVTIPHPLPNVKTRGTGTPGPNVQLWPPGSWREYDNPVAKLPAPLDLRQAKPSN
jgi:hypothetical protein